MWLWICTLIVGFVPDSMGKRWFNQNISIMCFQVLSASLSSVITYHNRENLPKRGICVANHTSPIDVLVLACDNPYALVRHTMHYHYCFVIMQKLKKQFIQNYHICTIKITHLIIFLIFLVSNIYYFL